VCLPGRYQSAEDRVVHNPTFVDTQTPLLYNSSGIRMVVAGLRGLEYALSEAFT